MSALPHLLTCACLLAVLGLCRPAAGEGVPLRDRPNPHLADTPFSIFHHDGHCSAAQPLRGPEPGDPLDVDVLDIGGASSWILFGPRYPDGSRPIWGNTMSAVVKVVSGPNGQSGPNGLVLADKLDMPGRSITDALVLSDGRYVALDKAGRRIVVFGDATPGEPLSKVKVVRELAFPDAVPGASNHLSLTHDGWLVWLTEENVFGATPLDFSRVISYRPPAVAGEVTYHNAFPIDAGGNLFVVTSAKMMSIAFKGGVFTPRWAAPYDFSGTGRQLGGRRELLRTITGVGGTPSGTTPTLFGVEGFPRMVCVVDGREPNHLVVFWADEIPADWRALPGLDRRVAGVIALPFSTPAGRGFSAEDSPTAHGNEVAVAQWNGFFPERDALPGAQKVRWNPVERTMSIAWTNPDVVVNGVMTLGVPSGLLYSSGPKDGVNRLYGLDWQTGEAKIALALPQFHRTIDQGNQTILDDDRTLYFSGRRTLVRVRPGR